MESEPQDSEYIMLIETERISDSRIQKTQMIHINTNNWNKDSGQTDMSQAGGV